MAESRARHPSIVRRIVDTPGRVVLLVCVTLSAMLLIVDHRRHLLGWLPWLLILAFPALALLSAPTRRPLPGGSLHADAVRHVTHRRANADALIRERPGALG